MAITVVPGSASLRITQRPRVNNPVVNGAFMSFTSVAMRASGECRISGSAGDNPANWTLGLIQLQWIETNWGYYRGQNNNDGSIFVQNARPPARPAQGCRDTLTPGVVFVDNNPGHDRTVAAAGAPFPIHMTASFPDGPRDAYPLSRVNTLAGKTNILREVQLEFHFCTVLSLRSPTNVYQHLKHFYWNTHWQATFQPTNFANLAAPWNITAAAGRANSANVGNIIDGTPTDRRFVGLITSGAAQNCNAVATNAAAHPNVRENRVWHNFDVRR